MSAVFEISCSFLNMWSNETHGLHVGHYVFRHKGKKRKGRPNYPPFRSPLRRSARYCNKPNRGQRKRDKPHSRLIERTFTKALKAHNKARRQDKLIEQSSNVFRLPGSMFPTTTRAVRSGAWRPEP
ncbi:hypothetical protein LUCX_210 [Xanthomonas phage vB_XciM_LucasX]|nr:hypothetical protein LUCX_210 [Xanthomonas phage vB_XciM_LucasX]